MAAFVSAMNVKGHAGKVAFSYVLAAFVFIASIIASFSYVSRREIAKKEAQKEKYLTQLEEIKETLGKAEVKDSIREEKEDYKETLSDMIDKGSRIAETIRDIEPDCEGCDWDQLYGQSTRLRNQAFTLKRKLDALDKPEELKGINKLMGRLKKAVRTLTVSANYHFLYYQSETIYEEDDRYDIYRRNAYAAIKKFSEIEDDLEDL
jgi:hypothetical protein